MLQGSPSSIRIVRLSTRPQSEQLGLYEETGITELLKLNETLALKRNQLVHALAYGDTDFLFPPGMESGDTCGKGTSRHC